MVSLGFVGFGEAAYYLTEGLREEGLEKIFVFDVVLSARSEGQLYNQAIERVKKTGAVVRQSPADLADSADILVLAVPAQFTESAAGDLIPHLKAGQLLVDVTTAAPLVKKQLGEDCSYRKIMFADSPMLGPLIVDRHKVPIITCGSGAQRWHDEMRPFGMSIEVIEGSPGTATQIKLARSIFTKGFEALLVETFMFARKCGVESIVMDSIGKTLDKATFEQSANRYMASDLFHAARKAHEMKDAIDIMRSMGMTPMVGEGVVARMQHIADLDCGAKLKGIRPQSLTEICAAWEDCGAI